LIRAVTDLSRLGWSRCHPIRADPVAVAPSHPIPRPLPCSSSRSRGRPPSSTRSSARRPVLCVVPNPAVVSEPRPPPLLRRVGPVALPDPAQAAQGCCPGPGLTQERCPGPDPAQQHLRSGPDFLLRPKSTSTHALQHDDPSVRRRHHRSFSRRRHHSGRLGCGHLHPSGCRRRLP
jgi:hypothetical protein